MSHPSPISSSPEAHRRLIDQVRRRWLLARLLERAAAGWIAGLIAGLILWLAWRTPAALAAPALGAVVGALCTGRISRESVADRIDRNCRTQELFGTALRVGGTAGAWLSARADHEASRLSASCIPVHRHGRSWWAMILLASLAWMATIGLLSAAQDSGGHDTASFARRGTLLGSPGLPSPRAEAPGGRAALEQRGERPAGLSGTSGAVRPLQGAETGEAGEAGNRSAGEGAGGGAEATVAELIPARIPIIDPLPLGERGGEAGGGGAAGRAHAGEATGASAPGGVLAERPGGSSTPATWRAGREAGVEELRAMEQQVSAPYRALVREYFSRRDENAGSS